MKDRVLPEYKDGYGYLRVKVPKNCRRCKYMVRVINVQICTEYSKHNITDIDRRPVWCPIMNEKELLTRYVNNWLNIRG